MNVDNYDLSEIKGLEAVAQELATLIHVARTTRTLADDDKVVRCLKKEILLAFGTAQVQRIQGTSIVAR